MIHASGKVSSFLWLLFYGTVHWDNDFGKKAKFLYIFDNFIWCKMIPTILFLFICYSIVLYLYALSYQYIYSTRFPLRWDIFLSLLCRIYDGEICYHLITRNKFLFDINENM